VNQKEVQDLAALIVTKPCHWVSGLYVLEEAPLAAAVVVSATPDLYEVAVYNYSFLGFGDWQFFAYERIVWPVGAEKAYRYSLCDEVRLEMTEEIVIADIDSKYELQDIEADDVEEIARIFAPLLGQLTPLKDYDGEVGDIMDDDFGAFLEMFPGLQSRDTPNFWDN